MRYSIEPLTEGELAVVRRALRMFKPGSQPRAYNTLNEKIRKAEKDNRPALRLRPVQEQALADVKGEDVPQTQHCQRCGGGGSVTLLVYPFAEVCPSCDGEGRLRSSNG